MASAALAFSTGSQYLELSRPVLPVPLRTSTGFSAVITFQLASMPGMTDSNLLLLTSSTYSIRVRVAAATQAIQFEVATGGGATYTVSSAAAAASLAAWHTAVVRYERETHEMQVWVAGADSTQTSVSATVRLHPPASYSITLCLTAWQIAAPGVVSSAAALSISVCCLACR